jgi:hypothetical protein
MRRRTPERHICRLRGLAYHAAPVRLAIADESRDVDQVELLVAMALS